MESFFLVWMFLTCFNFSWKWWNALTFLENDEMWWRFLNDENGVLDVTIECYFTLYLFLHHLLLLLFSQNDFSNSQLHILFSLISIWRFVFVLPTHTLFFCFLSTCSRNYPNYITTTPLFMFIFIFVSPESIKKTF